MAQSTDTSINASLSGLAVRNGINENLAALFSSNSGASAPSPTFGGMLWLDTGVSPPVLRQQNAANTAWLDVVTSDYATATGMSLIRAASATAARAAIGVAPLPTLATAVGQDRAVNSGTGVALLAPAGGVWRIYWLSTNATGAVVSHGVYLDVGGGTVQNAVAGINHIGYAWRVA